LGEKVKKKNGGKARRLTTANCVQKVSAKKEAGNEGDQYGGKALKGEGVSKRNKKVDKQYFLVYKTARTIGWPQGELGKKPGEGKKSTSVVGGRGTALNLGKKRVAREEGKGRTDEKGGVLFLSDFWQERSVSDNVKKKRGGPKHVPKKKVRSQKPC